MIYSIITGSQTTTAVAGQLTEDQAMVVWLAIFGIIIFMILVLAGDKKPEVKPDPDEKEQLKLGKEMNQGLKSPEEIAEKEGYDLEHVKKWKDDYVKAAVQKSFDNAQESSARDALEWDLMWMKHTMFNQLGPDWEQKTDYHNRRMYNIPVEKLPEKKDEKK